LIETRADKFYRLLEDENNSKDLLKLPEDAYQDVTAHIKSIRAESSDKEKNLTSELSMAERKILSEIAGRLIDLRIQKFNRDRDSDVTRLTVEERYIVEPLIQSRKRFERVLEIIFNGQIGELAHLSQSVKQKYLLARFLQPYTAISGIDLATYGPFEPEDVAILPLENAKSLLKNGIVAKDWVEFEDQQR
jgi:DNA replication initiation complex subunit (GINS family)